MKVRRSKLQNKERKKLNEEVLSDEEADEDDFDDFYWYLLVFIFRLNFGIFSCFNFSLWNLDLNSTPLLYIRKWPALKVSLNEWFWAKCSLFLENGIKFFVIFYQNLNLVSCWIPSPGIQSLSFPSSD